ncbi:flavodoxin, partial [Anaerostipes sp.]
MSKILVAYFSASGTTGNVARNLAEAAGADI